MSATTIERNTDSLLSSGVPPFRNFPIAGGQKILYGTIVVVSPSGYIAEGFAVNEAVGAGVALATADNLTGDDGDKTADVGFGVYYFFSGTGPDAITAADYGKKVFVIDNQTVGATDGDGTRSAAGVVFDVRADGQIGVNFTNLTHVLA